MRHNQFLAMLAATAMAHSGLDLAKLDLKLSALWADRPRDHKRDPLKGAHSSIAALNRHTGQPHEHAQANARRRRQIAAGALIVSRA